MTRWDWDRRVREQARIYGAAEEATATCGTEYGVCVEAILHQWYALFHLFIHGELPPPTMK